MLLPGYPYPWTGLSKGRDSNSILVVSPQQMYNYYAVIKHRQRTDTDLYLDKICVAGLKEELRDNETFLQEKMETNIYFTR